jgi:hypothetical protein
VRDKEYDDACVEWSKEKANRGNSHFNKYSVRS